MFTLETDTMLYVNYISIKKKKKKVRMARLQIRSYAKSGNYNSSLTSKKKKKLQYIKSVVKYSIYFVLFYLMKPLNPFD